MTKCPFCGSEYVLFSKKKQIHICEDCGKNVEEAALQKIELIARYGGISDRRNGSID